MTPWVVNERAVRHVDVLERDPNPTHIGGFRRSEMHRIRMDGLLRPENEVESLKRQGLAAVKVL